MASTPDSSPTKAGPAPPCTPEPRRSQDLPNIGSLNVEASPDSPNLLRTGGRRYTVQHHSHDGAAESHEEPQQEHARHLSPATLTLERIMEQDNAAKQANANSRAGIKPTGDDKNKTPGSKATESPAPSAAPGPVAAKGKPRLMLMGQRRSGKSSISSVVFHKMPPNETLFLESTARVQKDSMHSFMDFQVWDFPGQVEYMENESAFDTDAIFGEVGALIWVIDAQDEYLDAIVRLNGHILNLREGYPHINIEVFIHKVDGLSDDYRIDIQRDIQQRVQDELSDAGYENAPVNFHLTSIYDHSIFEAFSKVIQKLIPHLPTLEALLNDLCQKCRFEKVYLFDVLSKIYIATDSTPVDMPSYEICSDFIDVIVDMSEIYGWARPADYVASLEGPPHNKPLEEQVGCKDAEACIVLNSGKRPVILREVNKYLALVSIMKEGTYDKMPLVQVNLEMVVQALRKVFEITKKGKN